MEVITKTSPKSALSSNAGRSRSLSTAFPAFEDNDKRSRAVGTVEEEARPAIVGLRRRCFAEPPQSRLARPS